MKTTGEVLISIPENFSFQEILTFLDRGFDDCLYHLEENKVTRLFSFNGELGLISISEKNEFLEVKVIKDKVTKEDLIEAVKFVEEWFDIHRDLTTFYQLLDKNHQLRSLSEQFNGSRLVGIPDLFEALCWAIIGQQINLKFAYQVKRSLVEEYGEKLEVENHIYYLFPRPEVVIEIDEEVLRKMKFSRQKITYIKIVCREFIDGKLNKKLLINLKNKQERYHRLVDIKGIGKWTANYVLMKSLRDMTCITYGDSGLNNAIKMLQNSKIKPTNEEIDTLFSEFKNWESYLNFYLWRTLE